MYLIDIIAAFDFLEKEVKIGTLEYERIKGSASFRFSFEKPFLDAIPKSRLSADLGNYLGVQAAAGGDLFSE